MALAVAVVVSLLVGVALGGPLLSPEAGQGSRPPVASAPILPSATVAPVAPAEPAPPGQPGAVAPAPLPPGSSAEAVAGVVAPSVVNIDTELSFGAGAGARTGLVLNAVGDNLTNNHVNEGATAISVVTVDTGVTYTAAVVGSAPDLDIAVIRIDAPGLTPIPVGDSAAVEIGDRVVSLGNGGGDGGDPRVAEGTVRDLDRTISAGEVTGGGADTLRGLIESDTPLQAGDSGGALVDDSGRVIGMNVAASLGARSRASDQSFAIPIAQALDVAAQMQAGVESDIVRVGVPGFLGVSIIAGEDGALVTSVQPGSPAAAVGLVPGDTVTTVDGGPVSSPESLSDAIKRHDPGEAVALEWFDQSGQHHAGNAVLTSGPAS
ncbi:MAG: S1C family serine protease [Acidimicrobiia bacterium]